MKPFTKQELFGVVVILLVVAAITGSGLITSLRRSRDAQRMADLGSIANAVEQFHTEYGFFPPSENGKIKACKGENFDNVLKTLSTQEFDRTLFISGLRACQWGSDSLTDLVDSSRNPYVSPLPEDPRASDGYSYLYFSNTNRYQVYTYLEGAEEETMYDAEVASRNLRCGVGTCYTGKSFSTTPLSKSIEEYEQELIEKAGAK